MIVIAHVAHSPTDDFVTAGAMITVCLCAGSVANSKPLDINM